jgi:hypothetical protein
LGVELRNIERRTVGIGWFELSKKMEEELSKKVEDAHFVYRGIRLVSEEDVPDYKSLTLASPTNNKSTTN